MRWAASRATKSAGLICRSSVPWLVMVTRMAMRSSGGETVDGYSTGPAAANGDGGVLQATEAEASPTISVKTRAMRCITLFLSNIRDGHHLTLRQAAGYFGYLVVNATQTH